LLRQTGHATNGPSCVNASSRVSLPWHLVFGEGGTEVELRPELRPPVLDAALVARLARLAD
jgi:hypothetical protein